MNGYQRYLISKVTSVLSTNGSHLDVDVSHSFYEIRNPIFRVGFPLAPSLGEVLVRFADVARFIRWSLGMHKKGLPILGVSQVIVSYI